MGRVEGCTPMDAGELQGCVRCGRGMAHSGKLTFYEVTVRQCMIDVKNVQRMHGMEMMLAGAVGIARALSPDNTVAQRIGQPVRRLLCQDCGLVPSVPAVWMED